MHAKGCLDVEVSELLRHALVCEEHRLLDEPRGVRAMSGDDTLGQAVGTQQHMHLRRIEINRPASAAEALAKPRELVGR